MSAAEFARAQPNRARDGTTHPSVSSKTRKPEMNSPRPGVVQSSSRYARRFSSVFSTAAGGTGGRARELRRCVAGTAQRAAARARAPMASKRLPIVPVDSSAARMPRPGATMAFAVAMSSAAKGVCIFGEGFDIKWETWMAQPSPGTRREEQLE